MAGGGDEEVGATPCECPICLQERAHLCSTSCGHAFCQPCLTRWIESMAADTTTVSCPICRRDLAPADLPEGVKPGGPARSSDSRVVSEPWTCRRTIKWFAVVVASVGGFVAAVTVFLLDAPNIDGFGY